MCRIDDCERSVAGSSVNHKARKPHTCCECGRTISAGERYVKHSNLFEHHWDTFKTCAHCSVAQQWLAKNCGGYVFEQVAEEIEEHAVEYPAIARSLRRVHRGMVRRWSHNGRLMNVPKMPTSIAHALRVPA
jgi:hypothetical protein